MFRTLYHAGLRSEEAALLDRPDVHFGRGPFGKLHVRFGKGARTSGPRPRWVPMLDGLDLVLRWFLDDVRGKFPDSPVLFADESGGRDAPGHGPQPAALPDGRWRAARPPSGSARMRCGGRARPTTTSAAWTWWRSSSCSVTGRSARRCGTSGPRRRSSRTPIGGRSPATLGELTGRGAGGVRIRWKLRMAAAQREVWTGTQLRRLLAERAGLELSSASVSALFTKEPAQVKLSTLAALCTALECTPNDLFEVDTTPVERPAVPARPQAGRGPKTASARGRSMPPL